MSLLDGGGYTYNYTWTAAATLSPAGNWLSVGPSPVSAGGTLAVAVDPTGLAPGNYNATITATTSFGGTSTVQITLQVQASAVARFGPANVSFDPVTVGQTYTSPVALVVQTSDGTRTVDANLPWTIASNQPWLSVDKTSGTGPVSLTVQANATGLAYGPVSGKLTVSSPTGAFPPAVMAVGIFVRSATFAFVPGSLAAEVVLGANKTCLPFSMYPPFGISGLYIIASGSSPAPWLSFSPSGGFLPTAGVTINACLDPTGLAAGVYKAALTIGAPGISNYSFPIQLTVDPKPLIKPTPPGLSFTAFAGVDAAPQTVAVTNSGGSTLAWQVGAPPAGSWWTVSPSFATGNSTGFTVTPHTASLAPGPYTGSVSIFDSNAGNSPFTVMMTLNVKPAQAILGVDSTTKSFLANRGTSPASQDIMITNAGSGTLGWTADVTTQSGGTWLAVSPTSGSAPGPATLMINSQQLAAGMYTATVTFTATPGSNATNSPQTVAVKLTVGMPLPSSDGLVNGASFAKGPVSPGAILSLFGVDMTADTALTGPKLDTKLADTQVLVSEQPAPLFYVSPIQINFQMPADATGTVPIVVVSGGLRSDAVLVATAPAAPGIFHAVGTQAAALNADNSPNSKSNPAAAGSVVQLFVTGLGATNPPFVTGQAGAVTAPYHLTVAQPVVTIGGLDANVAFSGLAPGFVGLYQVNATIPAALPASDATPVKIVIGKAESNTATIAVH